MPHRTEPSDTPAKISYQGEPGANSHLAAREAYPDLEPVAYPTFEDAILAVKSGALGTFPEIQLALLVHE